MLIGNVSHIPAMKQSNFDPSDDKEWSSVCRSGTILRALFLVADIVIAERRFVVLLSFLSFFFLSFSFFLTFFLSFLSFFLSLSFYLFNSRTAIAGAIIGLLLVFFYFVAMIFVTTI